MTEANLRELERALEGFINTLTHGMGRQERRCAMRQYITGLLLDGERKSIEPIHVVYTVPPWLKIKAPGVAGAYNNNSQQIPCVKLREKDGSICQAGLDTLERLISKRGDWQRLLGERAALDRIALASGGYLRDLFRLLQSLLVLSSDKSLPADANRLEYVEHEIRDSYLPIPNDDALWLDRIAETHTAELDSESYLHRLARYFDTHLVLAYRNGKEWWSVHPLVAEDVRRQADRVRERQAAES